MTNTNRAESATTPVPPTTVSAGSTTSPVLTLTDPVYRVEHVALLLGCSIDRAREYTYLPDFPVPFQPGSRLLWLQAEVLAWLTRQPRKASVVPLDAHRALLLTGLGSLVGDPPVTGGWYSMYLVTL